MNIDERITDAEGFLRDVQGEKPAGQYTTVYPFDLEDLRNARRYLRILQADKRRQQQ